MACTFFVDVDVQVERGVVFPLVVGSDCKCDGDVEGAPCTPEERDPWSTEGAAITLPPTVSTERSQSEDYAFEFLNTNRELARVLARLLVWLHLLAVEEQTA